MIIIKSPKLSLNIEEISLTMKSTSVSTCSNYPIIVLRDPKTTPINVEYEIQHSHISLLLPNHLRMSQQVSYKKTCVRNPPFA